MFPWRDAFQPSAKQAEADVRYERSCTLFNLASLVSSCATHQAHYLLWLTLTLTTTRCFTYYGYTHHLTPTRTEVTQRASSAPALSSSRRRTSP